MQDGETVRFLGVEPSLGGPEAPLRVVRLVRAFTARCLAKAMLAEWGDARAMVRRAQRTLGYDWRFVGPLVERTLAVHPRLPPFARLRDFLLRDPVLAYFQGAANAEPAFDLDDPEPWASSLEPEDLELQALGIRAEATLVPVWITRMGERRFPVRVIDNLRALEEYLHLDDGLYQHLASPGRGDRGRPPGPLRNYRYRWHQTRLIEAPKPRLKAIQRQILRDILDHVPPDPAAHGFRAGRSIGSGALPHVGQRLVVHFDLSRFFSSILGARVQALFRALGYPESVARALMLLTTQRTPQDILRAGPADPSLRALLRQRHLPQGAPTSPALANLVAYALDRRLTGLARQFDCHYTRYADDLTFSGRLAPQKAEALVAWVALIAGEEGFELNHHKTRTMPASQRQTVTGLVVNQHLSTPRREYERLKAILHNAGRHGGLSQNREGHPNFAAHLWGRIGFVAEYSTRRGERLRRLYQAVDWGR